MSNLYLDDELQEPVVIPYTELSSEALQGVVETFVLREGTEYGANEFSLDQKVAHVMSQLERGEARVMFDPNSETVDIVPVLPVKKIAASVPLERAK